MSSGTDIKLQFTSVEKEQKTFYLRTISRVSFLGIPVGGLAYIILVNTIGLTLFTILLSMLIAASFNWLLTKFKMYKLYGWPKKQKVAIFNLEEDFFSTTLGNEIKKFEYTDISRVETIGGLMILWLRKTHKHNNKPIAIPIYSTAFKKIKRSDFVTALNKKISSINDFYPVINECNAPH